MNTQKRDMIASFRRVAGPDAVIVCDCGKDAAPFSCYCDDCERRLYAEEEPETDTE